MTGNSNLVPPVSPRTGTVRFTDHWRFVSWSLLDKGLPLGFGLGFVLVVVRGLPAEEFGLQALAAELVLTASQLLRAFVLVPAVKQVAEAARPGRVATTALALYMAGSAGAALLLWLGRGAWGAAFHKPELAAVLVPSAVLIAAGSARDATLAGLEGRRALRRVFWLDFAYYALALALLVAWRSSDAPRSAVWVQWAQAAAAGLGSIVAWLGAGALVRARPSRDAAAALVRYGTYTFGTGLGATLSQRADTLVVGRLLDARGVAVYGTAKWLFRIFNQLAQSISQVLFPIVARLAHAGRRQDLRVLYEKSVCFLHLAVVPVCAALWLAAPALLDLLFGGRYPDSVPAFRWLVVAALALPFASVGSPFLLGMGHARALLWITWTGLALGLALCVLWTPRAGAAGAALATCVAAIYGLVTRTVVLRRLLGFRLRDVARRWRDAWRALRDLAGRA